MEVRNILKGRGVDRVKIHNNGPNTNVENPQLEIMDRSEQRVDQQCLTSDEGETSSQKALRIGIILQRIFAHVPNKSLMPSCSLVNKTWNTEARKFIRDHGQCTAVQTEETTACEFLQGFDQICGEMAKAGRVNPFNFLEIKIISKPCGKDSASNEPILYKNLSELKLKYLWVSFWDLMDCAHHKPLLTLIGQKSSELESLEISGSLKSFESFVRSGWFPQLRKLEELDIQEVELDEDDLSEAEQQEILQWLLKHTPNLKTISVSQLRKLRIVPEEILARVQLQANLEVMLRHSDDIKLLHKISQKDSKLNMLHLTETSLALEDEDELDIDEYLRQRYDRAVEKMLQTRHENLETFGILGAYPVGKLSFPPLPSVKTFNVRNYFTSTLADHWDAVTLINFAKTMPRLETFVVVVREEFFAEDEDLFLEGGAVEWPPNGEVNADFGSDTVRELKLEIELQRINLRPFQVLFPNVSTIHFVINEFSIRDGSFEPLAEIWKCFPNLTKLKLTVGCLSHMAARSFDADFCGVFEEEAELLREQNETFPDNVVIVPIRPCVRTMTSLCKLTFSDNKYGDESAGASVQPLIFISQVAKMIMLRALPQLDISVPVQGVPKR